MSPTSVRQPFGPNPLVLAAVLAALADVPVIGANAAAAQIGASREAAGGRALPPTVDRGALATRLDSIVRAELAQAPLVGVSVAVLQGRDTVFQRGYGYADLGLQAPATEATTYRVFEENGRLMIQGTGEPAEPLLHQQQHSFRVASWSTATLTFTVEGGERSAWCRRTGVPRWRAAHGSGSRIRSRRGCIYAREG